MNASSQVFFAGTYTYRKPQILLGGCLFLAFGIIPLRYLVLGIGHTAWSLKALGAAIFIGGIGLVLALGGLFLLKRWLTRTSISLEISAAGIRYGKVFHSWDAIRWVSGRSERRGVQLFYQTQGRGLAGYDRPLPIDQNPTIEEYGGLMQSLSKAIQEKYPDVGFG